jgi:hypothetical protein
MIRLGVLVTVAVATVALGADDVTRARNAFVKGQQAYAAGRYSEALTFFQESLAAKAHPSTTYNIARCYNLMGDLDNAMVGFKEYLRVAPAAADADEVVTSIANIEKRLQAKGLQHLLVLVEPAQASVSIDGKVIGRSPAGAVLSAGNHTLAITAEGFEPYARAFVLTASRSMELTVSLSATPVAPKAAPEAKVEPSPPTPATSEVRVAGGPRAASLTPTAAATTVVDPPQAAPRKRVFTWVVAGVAAVGAGLSVTGWVLMRNAEAALAINAPRTAEASTGLVDQARTWAVVGNAAAITAGVAALAALILFFVEG